MLAVLTTSSFSIHFSCWEEHRFARTKASPVNISHWLASQIYLCSPSLLCHLCPIPLPRCQSFILCTPILLQPPLPQTWPHLSIHPSIFCLQPSISHSWHPSSSHPPSLSLSLCVFLYLPLLLAHTAFVWGLSWNVLRDPVSNTGTRNIWHIFNSQGQLQLFIQRLQLNFPRFPLDLPQIAVCVCHIFKSGQFPPILSAPCDFPSNISKAFKCILDMFYLWLSCAPSFLPQLC